MKVRNTVAIAAVGTLLLAGCGSNGTNNDQVVLKAADWYPEAHMGIQEGTKIWMDKVEEYTDGNVSFDHYPGEQLGKASDFLNLVQTGAADAALIGSPYYPSEMPVASVGQLPGLFQTSCEGTKGYWDLVKPGSKIAETELAEMEVVPVFTAVSPSYEIMTSKKPLEETNDAHGLKIRTSGGLYEESVTQIGASPTSITASEQYEALNRGTIDGTVFGYATAPDYSLEEVVKYGTVGAKMGSFPTVEVISKDVWDSIPEEYQGEILKAGEEASLHLCEVWDNRETTNREKWNKDGIIEVTEIDDSQQNDWNDSHKKVQEKWLSNLSDEQRTEAKQALDQLSQD
ncbi:TRAP-type C4-dicarboxylate transport system, substrate-binding protein [Brevibacterium sandarakinum]|uniref:TRAP-type C4-dicarboxylate transport system, substrate-binding protein n=1 Tax=Brevibacterium sandarakinum TaxID=629680 RepID=A0A1H1SAQ2_BRESA|nr:TRAP transporter substrate-binding protein DctP [Brevibacterium sandarakinum]SDS44836.1 TRAP-type C4-dicarboxylate transport system, substrate-binding protein [Brevibacterium sandarakinum]